MPSVRAMASAASTIVARVSGPSMRRLRRTAAWGIVVVLALVSALFTFLVLSGATPIVPVHEVVVGVFVLNGFLILLLLMAWPWREDQTGNESLDFGHDAGEFFALFLLSIAGLLLTTIANDLMLLFLALELVSGALDGARGVLKATGRKLESKRIKAAA